MLRPAAAAAAAAAASVGAAAHRAAAAGGRRRRLRRLRRLRLLAAGRPPGPGERHHLRRLLPAARAAAAAAATAAAAACAAVTHSARLRRRRLYLVLELLQRALELLEFPLDPLLVDGARAAQVRQCVARVQRLGCLRVGDAREEVQQRAPRRREHGTVRRGRLERAELLERRQLHADGAAAARCEVHKVAQLQTSRGASEWSGKDEPSSSS